MDHGRDSLGSTPKVSIVSIVDGTKTISLTDNLGSTLEVPTASTLDGTKTISLTIVKWNNHSSDSNTEEEEWLDGWKKPYIPNFCSRGPKLTKKLAIRILNMLRNPNQKLSAEQIIDLRVSLFNLAGWTHGLFDHTHFYVQGWTMIGDKFQVAICTEHGTSFTLLQSPAELLNIVLDPWEEGDSAEDIWSTLTDSLWRVIWVDLFRS